MSRRAISRRSSSTAPPPAGSPVTAGTQTYYLNGVMNLGASAGDAFDEANLVAMFYPS